MSHRAGRTRLALLFALAASLVAAQARAGDPAADAAAEGDRLTTQGNHRGAIVAYRRAAAADPSPARLCKIGLAYDQLGEGAKAHIFLDRCVAGGAGDAAARQVRDQRRKELDAGDYGLVAISADPAGARVALSLLPDDPPLATPLELLLPLGSHVLLFTAPGHQALARPLEITGRERTALRVKLEPDAKPGTTDVDFEGDGEAAGAVIATADPKPKKFPTLLRDKYQGPDGNPTPAGAQLDDQEVAVEPSRRGPLPWIMIGGGAAFLVGGVGFTLAARSAADDRDALPPDAAHGAADDKVRSRKTAAIACYAFGAAGVGVGAFLLIRGPRTRAGARPTGDGSGAALWLSHAW